jgi:predicted DNA-binding transcriptional regulator AlpA
MTTEKSPVHPGQSSCVRLLRLPEVLRVTGLSRSEWYRRNANGTAPSRIKLGERCSAWVESEVTEWVEARVAEHRGQA